MDLLEDYTLFVKHHVTPGQRLLTIGSDSAAAKALAAAGYVVTEPDETVPAAGSFDAVTVSGLFEQRDMPALLSELLRITKHGGLVLFHAPNILSLGHLLENHHPSRSESGKRKSFSRLYIRNLGWILKRTVSHKPLFRYYEAPDGTERPYLNPLDLKFCLQTLGASVMSYQEVRHIPAPGLAARLTSRFFGDHMSLIRLVARKGARYERH